MREQLLGVLRVPFPSSDLEGLLSSDAVGSCHDDLRVDQSSSTLVHVQLDGVAFDGFLAENRHHPGELSELGFVLLLASYSESYTVGVAISASFTVPGGGWGSYGLGDLVFFVAAHFYVARARAFVDSGEKETTL